MKTKELREKSDKELNHLLDESREKKVKLSFDLSGRNLKNHQEIRKTRKTIAKILTILKEKNNGKQ
jgi:large subunit ribosomal protein L29